MASPKHALLESEGITSEALEEVQGTAVECEEDSLEDLLTGPHGMRSPLFLPRPAQPGESSVQRFPMALLWRNRTPDRLLKGVAMYTLGDGGEPVLLSSLLSQGSAVPVDLAQVLLVQRWQKSKIRPPDSAFATVMSDSFQYRLYVAVAVRHLEQEGAFQPFVTCAWSHSAQVASPGFLDFLATLQAELEVSPATLVRRLSWLVHDVPAPATVLVVHAGPCQVRLGPSEALPLPRLGVRLLRVAQLLLLEQKVVFVSSSVSALLSACEAFSRDLLLPLHWPFSYMPLVPDACVLELPIPYLCGYLRRSGERIEADDFSIFDLDTGETEIVAQGLPALPASTALRLKHHLGAADSDLRSAFRVFMAELVEDAMPFHLHSGPLLAAREHSHSHLSFYSQLVNTQAFLEYIQTMQLFSQEGLQSSSRNGMLSQSLRLAAFDEDPQFLCKDCRVRCRDGVLVPCGHPNHLCLPCFAARPELRCLLCKQMSHDLEQAPSSSGTSASLAESEVEPQLHVFFPECPASEEGGLGNVHSQAASLASTISSVAVPARRGGLDWALTLAAELTEAAALVEAEPTPLTKISHTLLLANLLYSAGAPADRVLQVYLSIPCPERLPVNRIVTLLTRVPPERIVPLLRRAHPSPTLSFVRSLLGFVCGVELEKACEPGATGDIDGSENAAGSPID